MKNQFTDTYKKIPTSKLLEIIENPSDYQPIAVETAKIELASRQDVEEAKSDLKEKSVLAQQNKMVADQNPQSTGQDLPKGTLKRLIIWIISLLLFNIVFAILEPTGTTTDLRRQVVNPIAVKISVISTLIIGNSIIGFLLATLFSLIPYKNLPYSKKYLPTALILLIVLQSLVFLFNIKFLIHLISKS